MRRETIERENSGVQSIEDARTLMDQLDAAEDLRALDHLLQRKRLQAVLNDKADHVEVIISGFDVVLVLATIEELDLLPLERLTVDDRGVVMIVPHVVRAERPPS